MSPIIGIIASSISGNIATNSYESIATVTVGAGGSSSITFSSIPSTYKHLQIRGIVRDNRASVVGDVVFMRFNSDNTYSYNGHGLYGNGSSAASFALGTDEATMYGIGTGASANANVFGAFVLDILDYTNTNKYKVTRSLTGYDDNSAGNVRLVSGLWMNTSAINTIQLLTNNGSTSTLQQYSSFALYGVKG